MHVLEWFFLKTVKTFHNDRKEGVVGKDWILCSLFQGIEIKLQSNEGKHEEFASQIKRQDIFAVRDKKTGSFWTNDSLLEFGATWLKLG